MSNYLAERRKQLGYTQKEIASMVNVSEATVSRWESGEIANMRRDKINVYAKALKVDPSFIMTGECGDEYDSLMQRVGAIPLSITGTIPVLGRVAAGMPLYAQENIESYIPVDYPNPSEYTALRVNGDSMNAARIDDGDIIIIRKQDIVENGEIAVVIVNGDDATVKRYHRDGNTVTLTPQSYNPNHTIQIYSLKDVPIRIFGKVVEVRRSFV